MLKSHLADARCRCSADEFLVGVVGVRVWGAGGQDPNQGLAEGEEEQHEAASSEEAHDLPSGEDPTALLGHEPERKQKINLRFLTITLMQKSEFHIRFYEICFSLKFPFFITHFCFVQEQIVSKSV